MLSTTNRLSKKQKLAFYKNPDYTFIVDTDRIEIMREALDNLTESGGVFYSIYLRDDAPDQTIVVIYFDDIMIDLMGELF